jgi:hypothetical protein
MNHVAALAFFAFFAITGVTLVACLRLRHAAEVERAESVLRQHIDDLEEP